MRKFGMFIAKNKVFVLIVAALLLFPSLYGIAITKVNYDLLTYLPQNLDSMKGQEILDKTFSKAATGMLIVEDMPDKDVLSIKDRISDINGVESVTWISDIVDIGVPKEILPQNIKDVFYSNNSTLLMIEFTNPASSDETQDAISEIRTVMNKQCFLSGTSVLIKDTVELADKETPIYVVLAVALAVLVLMLTLESTIVPFIFLTGIGVAILYNMGSNVFLGEISYITKSLAAVLQLGVTMDYSIFLLHRYEEEIPNHNSKNEAMAEAISKTAASIMGSSLTTIAGFLALTVMKLTIGADIGIVMAKGVLFGVISTLTVLPALILVFDKLIHRFKHGTILPDFSKTAMFITKHYKIFVVLFIICFIPAIFGQQMTQVYYNLDESLPKDMPSIASLNKLKNEFNMTTTHMIITKDSLSSSDVENMIKEIEGLDGIEKVIGYDKFLGPSIPKDFIPEEIKENFEKGGYKLILVNSKYRAATDEIKDQLNDINSIVKSHDKEGYVAGEGALTKDLVEIADIDFKNVNIFSIVAIFAIILLLFYSLSIPIILVGVIELAILINMGIPFYTGTTIPFIASIVIGTIQLGATVDYAILLTTRFREEIRNGHDKFEAMRITIEGTAKSIVTSALTFFAATVGVGFIADMRIVKSLTTMISRGAIISMFIILFMLPAILIVSEKFISFTSRNWKTKLVFKLKSN